ncbi:MAG: phospholipid carrier-dependent glycosyltransferase [Dehalococcoidia bacterium]|nr:phospholipid carrier-dependent glycosyltransferase [Dehalococcoidia bacterium]
MRNFFIKLANWQYFGLLVIVLASFILHIAVISNPPDQPIFDETHYLEDARRILNDEGSQRNEHPPLARLIIAKSMQYIGDNPWGWRLLPIILSTLGLVLFYGICLRLSRSHRISFLAVFFLAFENLWYIHGGMAMLDIYAVFFMILAFWLYLKGPSWWWAAAVAGAAATLSKFTGLFVFIVIGLHWLYSERKTLSALVRSSRPKPPEEVAAAETDNASETAGGFRRVLIFVFSMLLAPVAFLLLYAVCEYFIWGYWRDLSQQINTALSGTNSIKFSYGGAYPSRPWEWFLSPINAFSIYKWMFTGGREAVGLLGYDWPPWGPHITGMTSPTIWLTSLVSLPWLIWSAMKRKLHVILPVVWFIGVGVVPALLTGRVSALLATIVSYIWFAMIVPIAFIMRKETAKDNSVAFALFGMVGVWAAWIPLAIITDRITYSFYYLPAIPLLCLGAGLLINQAFAFAENRHNRDFRGFIKAVVAFLLFFHLVVFCLLIPNELTISIPVAILVLAFSLDYLGYSYQTMFSATIAVTAGVLGLRFILYRYLERWFGTETILGLYPASIWFWVVAVIVTLAAITVIFWVFRRWILRRPTNLLPPAV